MRYFIILLSFLTFACGGRINSSSAKSIVKQLCPEPDKATIQSAPVDTIFTIPARSSGCIKVTALLYAARSDDLEWVQKEVKRGAKINYALPVSGDTVLMYPVSIGNILMTSYLLEHGADPNKALSKASENGATPLTIATGDQNIEIVKLLLEAGADPNIPRSDNGKTGASDGSTPLIMAASEQDIEIVKLLLEYGADPNIPSSDNGKTGASDGSTPLTIAASKNIEMVRLLLEHGADPNIARSDNGLTRASDGATPLGAAVANGRADIVKLLLEAGANPDKGRSSKGQPRDAPLMFAVGQAHNVEIARMLLEAGADLNVKSSNGYTAYDYAQDYGTAETVALLEEYMSAEEQTNKALQDILPRMGK